ncbi:MAG: ABC transporter ATP-binding protein, partial [Pseudomonadota bacterium]|nr:ABC transporter ATP-binding protein [Pseudomonadota bacterium]
FLNVMKNVEFGLKMRGVSATERRQRALDWLERLEISDFADREISQLSGGQQQRVALARSLVTEPRILLLDEPLSALDATLVVRMQGVLTKLQKELGITFVYVTHRQSEAFAMSDRVVIMNQGRIEQIDSAKGIYRNPATRFVAEFVGANNILTGTVIAVDGLIEIETPAGRFKCVESSDHIWSIGDTTSLVISADLIRLSTSAANDTNEMECRFISEEFVGSIVTVLAETPDGEDFRIQLQQRELSELDLNVGATIYVRWDSHDAHLLHDTS